MVSELGLPPVRLHDLRHGAASLAGAAGVELKVIQHDLGHSSAVTTADTYWTVFRELAHGAVAATADRPVRSSARAGVWSYAAVSRFPAGPSRLSPGRKRAMSEVRRAGRR